MAENSSSASAAGLMPRPPIELINSVRPPRRPHPIWDNVYKVIDNIKAKRIKAGKSSGETDFSSYDYNTLQLLKEKSFQMVNVMKKIEAYYDSPNRNITVVLDDSILNELLLFLHSEKCQRKLCKKEGCQAMKKLQEHMKICKIRENCHNEDCVRCSRVLEHWNLCVRSKCAFCDKVNFIVDQKSRD